VIAGTIPMSVLQLFLSISEILIAAGLIIFFLRDRRLRQQRDDLLQEKEVIFGFVHDVAEVFADASEVELEQLLKRVLYYALRTTRAGAGAIYLFEPGGEMLRARAAQGIFPPLLGGVDTGLERAMSKSQHVEQLVTTRLIGKGEGLVGTVADFGTPILIGDAEPDPRVPQYEVDFLKIRSILLIPMRFHQKVLGVLAVVNPVDGTPFIQADQNLLQALADQASVSIHYAGLRETLNEKQRIDHDLGVARRIQTALLPRTIPKVEGVELAAFNYPALEIGGDYYDFIQVDEAHLGIAIADVSGKGVGGAIMMSVCRSALRAQAPQNPSPARVLVLLNQLLSQDVSEDMFVSVLYMVLNTVSRKLTVARAGHERPILSSGGSRPGFSVIDSPGVAIGMAAPEVFESALKEVTVDLKQGDVVMAYTDGVTEAMNPQGEEWGIDRFMDAIRVAADEGANSVLNNVRQRLERFVGNQPQYDDMTLLALRVLK
jgi:phosphoserine phosphatase RsbU/P